MIDGLGGDGEAAEGGVRHGGFIGADPRRGQAPEDRDHRIGIGGRIDLCRGELQVGHPVHQRGSIDLPGQQADVARAGQTDIGETAPQHGLGGDAAEADAVAQVDKLCCDQELCG